jgi:RNA polymerase-binding transcription factor DksA
VTPTETAAVRAALADEKSRTERRLASLTRDHAGIVAASVDSNADDEHDPEGSTIAFERSQVSALAAQARAHLLELAAAEQRLHDGSYGRCESCGDPIATGRLEARPVARTCRDCAELSRG